VISSVKGGLSRSPPKNIGYERVFSRCPRKGRFNAEYPPVKFVSNPCKMCQRSPPEKFFLFLNFGFTRQGDLCGIIGLSFGDCMLCPKCGNKWSVVNTVACNSVNSRENLLGRVRSIVDWYGEDYVVRVRKCRGCGHSSTTVELIVKDLKNMFRTISKEGMIVVTEFLKDGEK